LLAKGCHINLKDCWCDIILLNVNTPVENKDDVIKDRFSEEREHVFYNFPRYRMKILMGHFNTKVGM
jgi:hypothetical protein